MACQQLRAHASVILDWLKLLDRMGWLPGSFLRVDLTAERNRAYALDGEPWVRRILAERRAEGLNRPYGPNAVRLGLGPLRPSRKQVHDPDPTTSPPPRPRPTTARAS